MAGPMDQGPAGRGDPAASPLRARDPSRLGPFTLLGRLPPSELGGRYLGRRVAGEQVEILHLRDELLDAPAVAARLRAKVDAARLVAGRGVVQVVDSDLDARPAWLATEHVQGLSFGEFVAKVGALPADRVHGFAVGVAEALAAIHAAGVVHGELKPKHVILTRMGPKVTPWRTPGCWTRRSPPRRPWWSRRPAGSPRRSWRAASRPPPPTCSPGACWSCSRRPGASRSAATRAAASASCKATPTSAGSASRCARWWRRPGGSPRRPLAARPAARGGHRGHRGRRRRHPGARVGLPGQRRRGRRRPDPLHAPPTQGPAGPRRPDRAP